MKKIPKFRRKPQPPTIQTVIQQEQGQGDGNHSRASSTERPPIKSTFRSFRLRGSGKRARSDSPASLPPHQQLPEIVGQDGLSLRAAMQEHTSLDGEAGVGVGPRAEEKPAMPSFMMLSELDDFVESRYQDLMWSERERVAEGMQVEGTDGAPSRWSTFKQTNPQDKGVMDRYMNIRPWNHNRVKLQVAENELDYVNASDISLPSSTKSTLPPLRYIAMQGPTEPSFPYVWRMVAERTTSSAVIVQLTNMMDGGIVKCHQYFPDNDEDPSWTLNEGNVWGDDWTAELKYDSVEQLAGGSIQKRKLLLHVKGEEEPRTIWHLLYGQWPDFGVPRNDDLHNIWELMRISHELSESQSSPRFVHCSAGIGRTGTFIALEHLIRELEAGAFVHGHDDETEEQYDPVFDTVDQLRQQRRGMVQGDSQLRFIYDVLRQLWKEKYEPVSETVGAGSNEEPARKRLEIGDPVDEGASLPANEKNDGDAFITR